MPPLFRDVKQTRSTRQQTPSSPRFSRGLELGLWLAGALLLTYGLAHFQSDKKVPEVTVSSTSHPEQVAPNLLPAERIHAETPAETYFKNCLAKIESEPDMEQREQLITSLVDSVAFADIQSLLAELGAIRQSLGQQELIDDISLRLVRRWARHDAAAASVWAQQLPAGSLRQDAMSGVAVEWANTGLGEAVAWGRLLPEPAEKQAVLFSVANEAVRLDPVVALQLATELPVDTRSTDLIQRSSREWAAADGEQAVTWARQIEDGDLRGQVLASMAVALSENDPVTAATVVTSEIPAGRAQSDAVVGIIERWAQSQPEQAAAWVEQFPDNDLKSAAVENVVAMWSLSDSQKAEQWRNQVLAGP